MKFKQGDEDGVVPLKFVVMLLKKGEIKKITKKMTKQTVIQAQMIGSAKMHLYKN